MLGKEEFDIDIENEKVAYPEGKVAEKCYQSRDVEAEVRPRWTPLSTHKMRENLPGVSNASLKTLAVGMAISLYFRIR